MWHERRYLTPRGEEHHLARCYTVAFGGKHYVGSRLDGTIYEQSLLFYADDGAAIRRVRRTPHVWDKNRMVTGDRFGCTSRLAWRSWGARAVGRC